MQLIDLQLKALAEERSAYAARLQAIVGQPDRVTEVAGYMEMIERLNAASMRLAHVSQAPEKQASRPYLVA